MRISKTVLFGSAVAIFGFTASGAHAIKGDVCNFGSTLKLGDVHVYLLHQQHEIFRKYDKDCDGKLSAAELVAFDTDQRAIYEGARRFVERRVAAGKPVPLDQDGNTEVRISDRIEPGASTFPSGWHTLLRDGPEDVGLFISPKPFDSASGATLGFSSDAVSGNTSWSTKGFASIAYYWTEDSPPSDGAYFKGYAIAPWVSFNRLTNSKASLANQQLNVLSLGLMGEVDFGRVLRADQSFRAKGALNADFDGKPRSWSTTAEWQPVSNELGISAPNGLGPFTWQIDPVLRSQYTERINAALDPIFVDSNQVWRLGPTVSLTIAPKKNDLVVPRWLQTTSYNLSYGWLFDVHSGRSYQLLNTALSLPIALDGHVGLKLSYQRGQLEETGQQVDQAMIGIGVKW